MAPTDIKDATTVVSTELAILFADISGSTRLYEHLGDEEALRRISHCLELVATVTRHHGGRLVKTIGDEALCVFPGVNDAISAACDINGLLAGGDGMDDEAGKRLAVRIGLHFGPAIVEAGDVFGDAINVAARMTAQAKARQIILSGPTRVGLSPMLKSCTRYVDRALVKGKHEPMEMYEFICHPDDATVLAELTMPSVERSRRLVLETASGRVDVGPDIPVVVIGRDASCDLVVDEMTASRQHLRIELRRNRFFVVDQSTNGTYIQPDEDEPLFARREEIALEGSGRLSLGCSFKRGPKEVVSYRVVEADGEERES